MGHCQEVGPFPGFPDGPNEHGPVRADHEVACFESRPTLDRLHELKYRQRALPVCIQSGTDIDGPCCRWSLGPPGSSGQNVASCPNDMIERYELAHPDVYPPLDGSYNTRPPRRLHRLIRPERLSAATLMTLPRGCHASEELVRGDPSAIKEPLRLGNSLPVGLNQGTALPQVTQSP